MNGKIHVTATTEPTYTNSILLWDFWNDFYLKMNIEWNIVRFCTLKVKSQWSGLKMLFIILSYTHTDEIFEESQSPFYIKYWIILIFLLLPISSNLFTLFDFNIWNCFVLTSAFLECNMSAWKIYECKWKK